MFAARLIGGQVYIGCVWWNVGLVDALDGFTQRVLTRCVLQFVACDDPFPDEDMFEQSVRACLYESVVSMG